LSYGP